MSEEVETSPSSSAVPVVGHGPGARAPVPAGSERPALYTLPFIAISLVSLLSFSSNLILQPVLPIIILEIGGDATLIGVVFLAFSIPSVLLRPFTGWLADTWSQRRTLLIGTLGVGVSGFLYVLASPVALILVRLLHGTAWAAFITSSHASMARLAPPERRAEASGTFNLMPGIAQMLMPALGLILVGTVGVSAPFVLAGMLGLAAFVLVARGPLPRVAPVKPVSGAGLWAGLIERSALLPMSLEFMFTAVSSLFWVFPPVLFSTLGLPVEDLAVFYLVTGGTLIITRLVVGRFVDRLPRHAVIAAGGLTAMLSLVVAIGAQSVLVLTVAGSIHAVAVAITSPMTMALTIDRAERDRLGAAMATYTIGFQLGMGVGALTWGIIIDAAGFPAPWVAGLLVLAAMLVVLVVSRRRAA